jgi:STELLO glycosyltransferases
MNKKAWLVVTSISAPNEALGSFATGSAAHDFHFLVIGDAKSPAAFQLNGCDYYSLDRQRETGLAYAEVCPTGHYARKNIGYLLAIRAGTDAIRDTDDDNLPRDSFWEILPRAQQTKTRRGQGWVNVYRWFSDAVIWPRGLPLDRIHHDLPLWEDLAVASTDCPIQQGLADENPDVDAIYRLTLPLPQNFRSDRRVVLGAGAWCPFNSQNTTWYPEAFPLLYLPAYCSFRMTDIWRSFVAQRIAWTNEWSILFHESTVWQERNEHNLMRDFADEVPGYLNNTRIATELDALPLAPGLKKIPDNLRLCYHKLVELELVGAQEIELLEAWLRDLGA